MSQDCIQEPQKKYKTKPKAQKWKQQKTVNCKFCSSLSLPKSFNVKRNILWKECAWKYECKMQNEKKNWKKYGLIKICLKCQFLLRNDSPIELKRNKKMPKLWNCEKKTWKRKNWGKTTEIAEKYGKGGQKCPSNTIPTLVVAAHPFNCQHFFWVRGFNCKCFLSWHSKQRMSRFHFAKECNFHKHFHIAQHTSV